MGVCLNCGMRLPPIGRVCPYCNAVRPFAGFEPLVAILLAPLLLCAVCCIIPVQCVSEGIGRRQVASEINSKIRVGMTDDQVKDVLGLPDYGGSLDDKGRGEWTYKVEGSMTTYKVDVSFKDKKVWKIEVHGNLWK